MPYNGGMNTKKELEPKSVEQVQPVIESPQAEAQPEVESWIEKIEKKFGRVPNQTPTPMDDSIVVQQPQSDQPPVTLPITQQQIQVGKKARVELSIAWLVTWMLRQIKILTRLGKKVRIQDIPEVK